MCGKRKADKKRHRVRPERDSRRQENKGWNTQKVQRTGGKLSVDSGSLEVSRGGGDKTGNSNNTKNRQWDGHILYARMGFSLRGGGSGAGGGGGGGGGRHTKRTNKPHQLNIKKKKKKKRGGNRKKTADL